MQVNYYLMENFSTPNTAVGDKNACMDATNLNTVYFSKLEVPSFLRIQIFETFLLLFLVRSPIVYQDPQKINQTCFSFYHRMWTRVILSFRVQRGNTYHF